VGGVVAVQRAVSQLNYLKQYLERFETFHAVNYKKEIREFMDFFSQDDIIGHLSRALFGRMHMSTAAWHSEVTAGGRVLPLPDDSVECFAFRLGSMRLIRRNKLDLTYFVANHFPGAHLNEMLMNWKRLIVHPFAEDCRSMADALIAELPDEEWVELEPLIETVFDGAFREKAFGPRAWTDADDDAVEAAEKTQPAPKKASPPAPEASPSVSVALDRLKAAIEAGSLDKDLLRDVEALRLEAQRQTPERARVHARLADLASHGSLAKACATLKDLL
jgi:hypothetical protein